MLGEHQDAELRPGRAQFDGGTDALVGERGRHPDVDHGDVGAVFGDGRQQLSRSPGCGGDLASSRPEQLHHALTQDDGILGQDNTQKGVGHQPIIEHPEGGNRSLPPRALCGTAPWQGGHGAPSAGTGRRKAREPTEFAPGGQPCQERQSAA